MKSNSTSSVPESKMKSGNNLKRGLLDQLKSDPNVNANDISVSVTSRAIILNGTVPTYADKVAASKSIEGWCGGLEVLNDLLVRLPETHVRADADIKVAVKDAIDIITTVPPESLTITVRNGWLKLEGSVEHCSQREAVEIAVRHLTGLVGMTDLISVEPLESQQQIGKAIKTDFERHAVPGADKINVVTNGTTVVLSGTALNLAAKEEAERVAWLARGVNMVENWIAVVPVNEANSIN